MHQAGIIKPSTSAWSFPLVPVTKRDGDVRPCADLREMNKISKFEAHPLPNIGECLASLKGSRYFTSLDLNKGFNQMTLTEETSDKCSFPFDGRLWKYCRVPFGLKQAPGWFQLQMQTVLQGLTPEEVLIYLDDFLINTRDIERHLEVLEQVLRRLDKFGLKIKPNKCEILKTEVSYLGHRISGDGISPLEESLKAIRNFNTPKTCREVKRFVGMAGWYRDFIPHFSTIARPLTQGMSKTKLEWSSECEIAFNKLKDAFLSTEVLSYPDYESDNPLILTSDASASGMGGYLSQIQEGKERMVGYYSKAFNDSQAKLSAFDKELEGIRLLVKHFRPHLSGKKVKIRTDHRPIVDLANNKQLNARLFRIYELLDSFDILIEYVPGKSNVISDALSRSFEGEEVGRVKDSVVLPPNLGEYYIPGGGDSLVQAVAHGLYGDEGKYEEIRKNIFTKLKGNPKKYGLDYQDVNTRGFKRLQLQGEPFWLETLEWVAQIYKVTIKVYQSGTLPIEFLGGSNKVIILVNRDGVHFNSTVQVKEKQSLGMVMQEGEEIGLGEVRISPNITKIKLQEWQWEDEVVSGIKEKIGEGRQGVRTSQGDRIWLGEWRKFVVREGLVVKEKLGLEVGETWWVPLVPDSRVNPLIRKVHEGLKHVGRNKVEEYLKNYFYFPNMRIKIGEEIGKCIECKMYKDHVNKNVAPHGQIKTTEPAELVCLDLAEMPKSKKGNKFMMIIVDHYTKRAMAVALRNKEGSSIAYCLEKVFLPTFNTLPKNLLSDNGREFKNNEVERILKKYGVQHLNSAPYYPANNGLVERTIQTFKSLIRTSAGGEEEWDEMLPSVIMVYNNSYHEAIGMSPAEIINGRAIRVVIPDTDLGKTEKYIPYKVGDRVLRKMVGGAKMDRKYEPGYVVTRVNNGNKTYMVKRLGEDKGEVKCHHNQLREAGERGDEWEIKDDEIEKLKELARLTLRPGWNLGGERGMLKIETGSRDGRLGEDAFEGFTSSGKESIQEKGEEGVEVVTSERRSTRQRKLVGYYQAG